MINTAYSYPVIQTNRAGNITITSGGKNPPGIISAPTNTYCFPSDLLKGPIQSTCQASHSPHPSLRCNGGSSKGRLSSQTQHSSQAETHVLQFSLVTGQPQAWASKYKSFAPVWLRFTCSHSRRYSQLSATASRFNGVSLVSSSTLSFHLAAGSSPVWWVAIHTTAKSPFLANAKKFCHFSSYQTRNPIYLPLVLFPERKLFSTALKDSKGISIDEDRREGQTFMFENTSYSHQFSNLGTVFAFNDKVYCSV